MVNSYLKAKKLSTIDNQVIENLAIVREKEKVICQSK